MLNACLKAGFAACLAIVLAACADASSGETASVANGYILAEIDVKNPEPYQEYIAAVTPMVSKFGGAYIVRAGKNETREGTPPSGRLVILKFPSFEAAKNFYDSAEYQAIAPLRTENAVSRIIVLEGYTP